MAKAKKTARAKSIRKSTKVKERDVTLKGEIDLHSMDAVKVVGNLEGTPIDDKNAIKVSTPPEPPVEEIAPPPEGKPRILLVIPMLSVSFKFFESFLKFWQEVQDRVRETQEYEIGYYFIHRKPVHIAEIMGVEVAKLNKCTHILFMDDDIYDVTPDMLEKLIHADKDVIAGVMYASGFPYAQCTFRRYDTETTVSSQPAQTGIYRLYEIPHTCPHCAVKGNHTDLGTWEMDFCPVCRTEIVDFPIQKVDLVPFCFTLMKISVFDRIAKPWFHCNSIFPTDSWFADRCIEAGIQEYAHMLVRLNHAGVNDLTRVHRFNSDLAVNKANQSGIIKLTEEQMAIHIKMMEDMMSDAEVRAMAKAAPDFLK